MIQSKLKNETTLLKEINMDIGFRLHYYGGRIYSRSENIDVTKKTVYRYKNGEENI